jgi:hypothetical protein
MDVYFRYGTVCVLVPTTHFMIPHNVVRKFHVLISVHGWLSRACVFIHRVIEPEHTCLTAYRRTRRPATEGEMEFRPINLNFQKI